MTVRASGPWWLGMTRSGTTVFMMPEWSDSHGSVARRTSTPRAFLSRPASCRAPRVRTVLVVLQETTRVKSRPTALA